MNIILHIADKNEWEKARKTDEYRDESLERDGFIHSLKPNRVMKVANLFFKERSNLLLLVIDEDRVLAEIKYEDGGDGKLNPHLYGALNTDAVVRVIKFQLNAKGKFEMPEGLN